MSEHDKTDPVDSTEEQSPSARKKYPKAMRIQRLAAALIDQLIVAVFLLPIAGFIGYFDYMQGEEPVPIWMFAQLNIISFVLFLLVNGWLLYRYGQTIGKRYLKIAIATEDFQVPNFNRLIALRYLPFTLANVIPALVLIPLIDVLMIFRDDRRCLHDMLARTQVIDIRQAG